MVRNPTKRSALLFSVLFSAICGSTYAQNLNRSIPYEPGILKVVLADTATPDYSVRMLDKENVQIYSVHIQPWIAFSGRSISESIFDRLKTLDEISAVKSETIFLNISNKTDQNGTDSLITHIISEIEFSYGTPDRKVHEILQAHGLGFMNLAPPDDARIIIRVTIGRENFYIQQLKQLPLVRSVERINMVRFSNYYQ